MPSKPNSASLNFRRYFIFATLLSATSFLTRADAIDDAKDLLLANDYAGAYQKLQEPAAQGNAEAQYQLATLYRMGLGVAADNTQALQWYERAAAQNHAAAQYLLATMYEQGLGTKPDNAQSLNWLKRAAANGSAQAQQKLAGTAQQFDATTGDVNERLLHAARKGDNAQIAASLTNGANIDTIDDEGNTALMLAASGGNADSIDLLLAKNAAVNVKNHSGDTALLLAANSEENKHTEDQIRIVKALLEHGADINAVDHNGNNALMIAAMRSNISICKLLLPPALTTNSAIIINAKNAGGDNALDLAKRVNNPPLVQLLTNVGIKSPEKNVSPAANATAAAQITAFAQRGDTRYANWPALNIAAWRGDATLVDTLLKQGSAVDSVDPENFTPLMRAILQGGKNQGDNKIAVRLLDAGANSNRIGPDQKTALWLAVERNDSALVDLLLRYGAQANAASARTDIVAFAAKTADEKIMLALLANASDVETVFADGTALQWCAQRGFAKATQQLITQHAQIDRGDNTGRSALWLAAANNKPDIVELLLRAHAASDLADRDEVTPLAIAATRGNTSIVDALIRSGANIDKATREGNTPLLLAARNARPDILKQLLSAKADVEHRNERSETALMLAAASGSSASVAALLDAGADAARRDKNRQTAVDYARQHKYDELAQRLQDHIEKKQKFSQ